MNRSDCPITECRFRIAKQTPKVNDNAILRTSFPDYLLLKIAFTVIIANILPYVFPAVGNTVFLHYNIVHIPQAQIVMPYTLDGKAAARIARAIDHTALQPQTTSDDVRVLCEEAAEYGFASVCVTPVHVQFAARMLAGTDVKVGTVIGFPLGATLADVKKYEAVRVMTAGAWELDVVANIALLKAGEYAAVNEIASICKIAHPAGVIVKVIIETSLLSEEEKIRACDIVAEAGADYIKTSTGFSATGASVEDVALLRKHSPASVRVKASGGLRDAAFALALLDAGAERLGTSKGVAIIQTLLTGEEY